MVVISVYTYGVKIIKKFRWESGFLWGVPWNPPLCTNGSAGYLMQLSDNPLNGIFQINFYVRVPLNNTKNHFQKGKNLEKPIFIFLS